MNSGLRQTAAAVHMSGVVHYLVAAVAVAVAELVGIADIAVVDASVHQGSLAGTVLDGCIGPGTVLAAGTAAVVAGTDAAAGCAAVVD